MIKLPDGFRQATDADADLLAELVMIASHGVALKIWEDEAPPGVDPRAYGAGLHAARAARGEVVVYDPDTGPVAGLTSYAVSEAEEEEPGTSPSFLPIVELEAQAVPCWYILVLAVLPEWRGRGLGKALLRIADDLARSAGMNRLALVVADGNGRAVQVYEAAGYGVAARAPMLRPGVDSPGTDWLLWVKSLSSGSGKATLSA